MQLLQVTTLLIEGRGEESPVKEDGCSGKKAPIEWHRKSKGNQSYKTWWFIRCIFRHYQVRLLQKFYIIGFLGFLNSTISDFFSYKIKLPVCKKKKTFFLTNHNQILTISGEDGLMRNAYLRKPNLVLRFYINKSHHFESFMSLDVLT